MNVAVYARVSTRRQAQDQGVDAQLERLLEHARQQGWSVSPDAVFRDDGYSGASLGRPGLGALRALAAGGGLDRVLVAAPDRLARAYVHQVLLLEELERGGCQVVFLERPMSSDPHDQLLLQIRGAVAQYERSLIAERMRRGRLAKLKAGLLLPWTSPPYGYRLDPDRPRDPAGVRLDESQAVVVKELFAGYLEQGATLFGLARRLEAAGIPSPKGRRLWSLSTLRVVLSNPTYTGQVYANRHRVDSARARHSAMQPVGRSGVSNRSTPNSAWVPVAAVPAVVSQEVFDRVQQKLAVNRQRSSRNNKAHPYLLRALVSCGRCGLACNGRTDRDGYSYYVCQGKSGAINSRREERCLARMIPVSQLDELVWADLGEVLADPRQVAVALERAAGGAWLPQEFQARRAQLRRGRASLRQQVERLTEAYLAGVVQLGEYQRRRAEVEGRLASLEAQETQLGTEADRGSALVGMVESLAAFCVRVRGGLDGATFEQRRALVELLVDRVVVTGEEVEIRYVVPLSAEGERAPFCQLRTDYLLPLPFLAQERHLGTPQHRLARATSP